MADATVQGYDIIGDVHGCAGQLEALLSELGYHKRSSTSEYRHPERQVIFVGDLIDRGDEQTASARDRQGHGRHGQCTHRDG